MRRGGGASRLLREEVGEGPPPPVPEKGGLLYLRERGQPQGTEFLAFLT